MNEVDQLRGEVAKLLKTCQDDDVVIRELRDDVDALRLALCDMVSIGRRVLGD